MTKKQGPKKSETSQNIIHINAELERGNYLAVRKFSHRLLALTDRSVVEIDCARRALKISWPDSLALLVGFLCLLFSVLTLFLSAY